MLIDIRYHLLQESKIKEGCNYLQNVAIATTNKLPNEGLSQEMSKFSLLS
jgi:hypothetical protein